MTIRIYISFTFCLACMCLSLCGQDTSNGEVEKPNVIVIIADDLGWADVGYNNPENAYTPHLDRLASRGVVFERHYVMPQCTPTRVALFTGKYPGRFGREALQANNNKIFPIGTPTLATMFHEEGYRTYLCGKWHMGSDTINGPNHHGFDQSYGSLAGAVGMYDHRYRPGKWEQAWHRNHSPIPGNENGVHTTDLIGREVQQIIKTENDPFFIMATFNAPHTPLDERGEFVERPTQLDPHDTSRWLNEDQIKWFNDPAGIIQSEKDPERRLFLSVVYHLDHTIGQIIGTLENMGKLENTIILFSSDNGPQINWNGNAYPDDLHLTDFNQDSPFRGSKTDVYEGGILVPGFIYWKNRTPNKSVDQPVHIIDWFPTLANIIHHDKYESYDLDGIDLGPLIFQDQVLPDRSLYWVWNKNPNRWALQFNHWKIVQYGSEEPNSPDDWELYDLLRDPYEKNDISARFPQICKSLHKKFMDQREKDRF